MTTSSSPRGMLPLVALQGAIATMGGFIGFFVISAHDGAAMMRYTAIMLTVAMLSSVLSYGFGARLGLCGKRLFKAGFLLPGLLMLAGSRSIEVMGAAYGAYLGMTWSARHLLEMSVLQDSERDAYASHTGTLTVIGGLVVTLLVTLALAAVGENSRYVYLFYGALSTIGGIVLGNRLPQTAPIRIHDPVAVVRQPEFIACLPLFFLESGLFGITQTLSSSGAVKAVSSASGFGSIALVAGLAGGVALYVTRQHRDADNRRRWLGGACLTVGSAFVLLGASVWLPVLYVGYCVLKSVGGPFLAASEQVLNQRTLDISGTLPDRILARECVLWALRMTGLGGFWMLSTMVSPTQCLVIGSLILASAIGMEYVIGQSLLWPANVKRPLSA